MRAEGPNLRLPHVFGPQLQLFSNNGFVAELVQRLITLTGVFWVQSSNLRNFIIGSERQMTEDVYERDVSLYRSRIGDEHPVGCLSPIPTRIGDKHPSAQLVGYANHPSDTFRILKCASSASQLAAPSL